jgi:hypothetical protein
MYYKSCVMRQIICSGAFILLAHSGWSQLQAARTPVKWNAVMDSSLRRTSATSFVTQLTMPGEGGTGGFNAAITTSASVLLTVLEYDASDCKATIKEDYLVGNSKVFRVAALLKF